MCFCTSQIKFTTKTKELTGKEVFNRYIKALGGKHNLAKIKSSVTTSLLYINNKYFGKKTIYIHYPDKVAMKYYYFNGKIAWEILNGKNAIIKTTSGHVENAKKEDIKYLTQIGYIFPELYYLDHNYDFDILKQDKNNYAVRISKGDFYQDYYINKLTYECSKISDSNSTSIFLKDTIINNVSMPLTTKTISLSNPKEIIIEHHQFYKINEKISDSIFDMRRASIR